eukprot:COSAG02_NODE_456_length_21968_cov_13.528145_10_plen_84_part_00
MPDQDVVDSQYVSSLAMILIEYDKNLRGVTGPTVQTFIGLEHKGTGQGNATHGKHRAYGPPRPTQTRTQLPGQNPEGQHWVGG